MSKKIVVLAVFLECILAVFLISFFGKIIEDLRADVLCEDIYFTYETGEKIEDGVSIEVTLTDSKASYQLYWALGPENVSNKEVSFTSSKPEYVVIDGTGNVTFFEDVDVVINIKALDGSGKTDSIMLIPKRNTSGGGDI